jgi:hypothetical protein
MIVQKEEKGKVYGEFSAELHFQTMFIDVNMEILRKRNKVVNDGLNWMVTRFISDTSGGTPPILGIAVGTGGSTAPTASDHTLKAETARVESSNGTSSAGGYSAIVSGLFSAAQLNGSSEVGLLTNSTSGGVLICRGVYTPAISGLPTGSYITFSYALGITGD